MAKLLKQCRLCRREGEKLFLKGDRCSGTKCAILRRNYKPGMHGPKEARQKVTDYGKQLRAKQSAKRIYGLSEKQFANYVEKAIQKRENTAELLINFLEMRLDNVLYRLGFCTSRNATRQMVGHEFVLVNNKKVNIPSYQVKPGDIVSINPVKLNKKKVNEMKETIKGKETPEWISFNKEKLEAKIISFPKLKEGENIFEVKTVIEFYSR